MIKGIAAKLVSHLFCEYIDRVDSSQLELGIWNGVAKLENLSIRKDALVLHQLPFSVNRGTVGAISLRFPWGSLGSQPCVVDIEDVFLVCTIAGAVLVAKDLEVKPVGGGKEEVSEGSKWSSLMNKIVDNIQINVRNVHLRVESPAGGSLVAFGVTMKSLATFSIDETGAPAFLHEGTRVLRKKVEIEGLSVYIDTGAERVSLDESFVNQMREMIEGGHQYLLEPFVFSGVWKHYRETPEAQDGLSVETKALGIRLDLNQWRGLNELGKQYRMFNKRRMYSHLGKPDRLPRSERSAGLWWRYAEKCATFNRIGEQFDANKALEILQYRSEYMALVERGDEKEIEQFEDEVDPGSLVFLKSYVRMKQKLRRSGTQLTKNELQELAKMSPEAAKSIGFHITMEKFQISIADAEMKPVTAFVTEGVVLDYVKSGYDHEVRMMARQLSVFNELSRKYRTTFASHDMKLAFMSKASQPSSVDFETSKVTAVLDINLARQLVEFFNTDRLTIDNRGRKTQQIQAVIEQHAGMSIKVRITESSLLLPYQEIESCPCMSLFLRELNLTSTPAKDFDASNYDSLYETYSVNVNGAVCALDGQRLTNTFHGTVVCQVAIADSEDFPRSKVAGVVEEVDINVSLYQYLLCTQTLLYFVDSLPHPDKSVDQASRDLVNLGLKQVKFSLLHRNKPVYQLMAQDIAVGTCGGSVTANVASVGLTQYITSNFREMGKLAGITVKASHDMIDISVAKCKLNATSDSTKFIYQFFSEPSGFEERMKFPVTYDFDAIKHKRRAGDPVAVHVALKDFSANVHDSDGLILQAAIPSADICFESGKSPRVEVHAADFQVMKGDRSHMVKIKDTVDIAIVNHRVDLRVFDAYVGYDSCVVQRAVQFAKSVTIPESSSDGGLGYIEFDAEVQNFSGSYENFTLCFRKLKAASQEGHMDKIQASVQTVSVKLRNFEFLAMENVRACVSLELVTPKEGLSLSCLKSDPAMLLTQKRLAHDMLVQKTGNYWLTSVSVDVGVSDFIASCSHELIDTLMYMGARNQTTRESGEIELLPTLNIDRCRLKIEDAEHLLDFRLTELSYTTRQLTFKSLTEAVMSLIETSPVSIRLGDEITVDVDNINLKSNISNLRKILLFVSRINFAFPDQTGSTRTYCVDIQDINVDFQGLLVHARISARGNKYELQDLSVRRENYILSPLSLSAIFDDSLVFDIPHIVLDLTGSDIAYFIELASQATSLADALPAFTTTRAETSSKLSKRLCVRTAGLKLTLFETIFLIAEARPSELVIDENFVMAMDLFLSLTHLNRTTGNTDMIMEYAKVGIRSNFVSSLGNIQIEFSREISFNLTSEFILSVLHTVRNLNGPTPNLKTYSVRNITGEDISLTISEKDTYVIPQDVIMPLGQCSGDMQLSLAGNVVKIRQLCYPVVLRQNTVFSLSDGVITVSSPYKVRNNFGFAISIWSHGAKKVIDVPGHSEVALPSAFPIGEQICLTDSREKVQESEQIKLSHWNSSRALILTTTLGTFKCKLKQSVERDSFGILTISPTLSLMNELPDAMTIIPVGESEPVSIRSGQSVDLPRDMLTDTELHCYIQAGAFLSGEKRLLVLNEEPQPIRMTSENHTIIICGKYESGKFCFFAPCIIKNCCPYTIDVRNREHSGIYELKDEYLLFGSVDYTSANKMCISYRIADKSTWSDPVDCLSSGVSSVIFAPVPEVEQLFVSVHYYIASVDKTFEHTRILTFSPELSVVNETGSPLTLTPLYYQGFRKYSMIVGDSQKVPVFYTNREFTFECEIGDSKCNVRLSSPCQTALKVGRRNLYLEIVEDGGGRCAHFRNATFPTPVVICNDLQHTHLEAWQSDASASIVIQQNTTTWFLLDDPLTPKPVIYLSIENYLETVDISCNFERKRLGNTVYFVSLSTTVAGNRILVVGDSEDVIEPFSNFEVLVTIENVNISLIDDRFRELALVNLRQISYRSKFDNAKHLIEFKIRSVQLDDQYSGAVFPVVISGKGTVEQAFLHLSAVSHRNSPAFRSFSSFVLSVQRIDTFLDLAFVSDIISFFMQFVDSNATDLQQILVSDHCQEKETAGPLYSFEALMIHPILLTLTFRGHTRRKFSIPQTSALPMNMFKLIPSLTTAPIEIPSFTVENFLATKAFLKMCLQNQYQSAALAQVWKLAGHLDILFNAGGIAGSIGQGFKQTFYDPVNARVDSPEELIVMAAKGGGELIKGTVGSIIKGGEGFVRNISSYVSMLDPDNLGSLSDEGINQTAGDTVINGFMSLGANLVGGVTGLITKPVEGGRKDGITGAISGVGRGLLGLVAKPVAGVLEFGAGVLGGVRKAIDDEEVIQRIRLPKAFPLGRVQQYQQEDAAVQWLCARSDITRGTVDEVLRATLKSETGDTILAVCNRRVFMYSNGEVVFCRDMDMITNVQSRDRMVVLQIRTSSSWGDSPMRYELCANSSAEAQDIVAVIHARINFYLIFSML